MPDFLRVVAAQINPTAGDFAGNIAIIQQMVARSAALSPPADVVLFPEMALTGYPIADLARRPAFGRDAAAAVETLAAALPANGPAVVVGGLLHEEGAAYNAAFLIENNAVEAVFKKHRLPNDGVFDEERLFAKGPAPGPVGVRGIRLGVAICEDLWRADVAETLEETGSDILLVLNGSPYDSAKYDTRVQTMVARVVETGLPLVYVNLTGGQDDLVFDGGSFVLNPGGELAIQAPWFEDALMICDFNSTKAGWRCAVGARAIPAAAIENDYRAMVLATRDYVLKSGFTRVMLGLSGGVDSALVAAVAADALGPDNVWCVMLPSEHTSDASLEDAAACAAALSAPLVEISIIESVAAALEALRPLFADRPADATEENLQSRMRGLLLMALSNKFGHLLLTTGNKSEVATGYATLYGDMCGAFNPLKDLYKTRVFAAARWRNETHRPWMRGPAGVVIPQRIIDKPPSAELRPDQKDSDSLPDYAVLDPILMLLIEEQASVADVVAAGHAPQDVALAQRLLYQNEYKRRQSAPGVKLTKRAFWLDRRYPIVNRWRDQG